MFWNRFLQIAKVLARLESYLICRCFIWHTTFIWLKFPLTCSKLLPPLKLVAMILLKVRLKHNKSINLELLGLQKKLFRFNLKKNIADTGILVSHWPIYKNKFSSENTVKIGVRVTVFDSTFNNISVISWWSVLLVEETGVPGEKHRPAAIHWQTLSHNVVSSTPHHDRDSH